MFATVGTAGIGHQVLPWIGVAAGATLFGPLTLALGGSWLAVYLGFRAIKAGRQNLQQWINATAGAVTKVLNREVQERQEAVRPIITNLNVGPFAVGHVPIAIEGAVIEESRGQ